MKFLGPRRARSHPRRGGLDEPHTPASETFVNPAAHRHQIHTYAELRQQIHDDLRVQHPEWVQANGESPICDVYEARLRETLDALVRRESNDYSTTTTPHHILEHGLN